MSIDYAKRRETQCNRIVSGCVCVNEAGDSVLLIGSSRHNNDRWVLPKGGVDIAEDDDGDYVKTAIRETWEEAGATGTIVRKLEVIPDQRSPAEWAKGSMKDTNGILMNPPKSEFHFYEMKVEKLHDEFPESATRRRKWFTLQDAVRSLLWNQRPELAKAVQQVMLNSRA
ncbi:Diphosphoinositol polyphosphate phosphohydrolase DDP1; AltName: Full=Diadenosine and diphosphoinositol polyphosphate phosphohydrolase 1; AltName: Full=Diadenosine 5',5'''-P1,P6-hexaphosphate hydrolase; Short=AP6A hydrolase [Cyberlindnera jadinii]|uniref:Nudix hydrolase domain-containing protein n=1 Tax=Cyberlindnera jadinii (strain ATCC 18201 / CBS 1600 / BCRC 20928 / JCM 3617 / NBRC 0987 / NRRL Y-1542) TaxID=983966 RepID=A0A0H5C2C1_CYBJN|nr:Diphosphoinositol polyphosphate phosphohydrolase DDP1; AltName: Full=Diadenosine and diphosphoinositol polyphosphate phosphohydrolase 1; AltName: Full=Diadenosine 5',5'''-P1,P6-hexaphosphate hydrolase; Short=AP6A hydrolase [Cyberlindnera jadinii]